MNAIQTKVAIIHYQRNYGNHGPLCSDPRSEPPPVAELATNTAQVTCKDCIKRFKTIGIVPGKVRKLTPKHLGRLSEEERQAQEAGTRIHAVRSLKEMLINSGPDLSLGRLTQLAAFEIQADRISAVVKHWLMDCEHQCRMNDQLDEQAVIQRLINLLS
jgi:hypothetical protein